MTNYQISNLIIKDPQNKFKGEIFINEEEIDQKGSLLILVEIESNTNEAQEIITDFLQIAYSAYKQSLGNSPDKVLEDILHQLNQKLVELPHKEKNWYKKINAIVGLSHQSSLHFSAVGNINAFLIRQAQITDLIKDKIESQGPQKIFSTIISGSLNTNDAFLFTTATLLDYIATEKIKRFINALPPMSAAENLKNLLANVSPVISFLAIIIKQRSVQKSRTSQKIITYQSQDKTKISSSEKSINKLLQQQKETAEIIKTPTLTQTILTKIKGLFLKLKITKKQSSLLKLSLGFLIINLIKLTKFIALSLYQIINICLGLISTQDKRQQTIDLVNKNFAKTFNYLKNLSKTKKIAGIIFLIILLLLSQNLILASRRQQKVEEENKYQANLSQIKNLQDTIEASLIYNDEIRAQETLEELINLINDLPTNSKARIAKTEELKKSAEILIQRVWKLVNITSPVELLSLNLEASYQPPEILKIINNELIILSDNKLWTTSLNPIELSSEEVTGSHHFIDATSQLDDNSFVVWTEENKIFAWQNHELKEKSIQYSPAFKNIAYLAKFRNALYILDNNANQIYKHLPSGENYGPGLPWVKEPNFSLNNTISMAIDGSIYLLEENGQLQKFLAGKKQDFPQISIYPSFNKPQKIFTDQKTINLYILDPENNRVVVFNKDGELINQYYSEKFNNLKDFIVQEQEKKIYLLNDNKVYVISIF